MYYCIVKFKSGDKKSYKTNFDGLDKGEEVVVEVIKDGQLGFSRADFVKYVDIADKPDDELRSVVGRWVNT